MKSVVVTGVSTGIGWGITKILVQKGFRVFGSVRKEADAERLCSEFGANFVPLLFDVTDETAVQSAALQVREQLDGDTLFGLVNNAGVAFPAPLIYQPTDDFRRQLEVNLVSVLIVTKAFVPLLGIDPSLNGQPGRIINISSVGGRNGNPFMGAYAASKHGLEGFSESLRRELMLHGIDVIIVGPGAVATPIWDKAEQADFSQFENTEYYEAGMRLMKYMVNGGRTGFPPERVGEVVLHALTTPRPRVRYAVIQINSLRRILQLFLPKRMMDRIVARYLGFRKR
ncbi:MAG TPA: SDR family NAD(P)-dependent oxidoreductase [Anaerolineales bacterium]|nr:SDR family NAD(P)-dependent oxidoreductase [Anaerolineales bacterium]